MFYWGYTSTLDTRFLHGSRGVMPVRWPVLSRHPARNRAMLQRIHTPESSEEAEHSFYALTQTLWLHKAHSRSNGLIRKRTRGCQYLCKTLFWEYVRLLRQVKFVSKCVHPHVSSQSRKLWMRSSTVDTVSVLRTSATISHGQLRGEGGWFKANGTGSIGSQAERVS